ncbi:MAG: ATP-binding protein, partial [Thermoplasmata archaeon]
MDYRGILNKPALIGREKELSQLKEMLDSMLAGHGGLVFISGEAGIGKTRLIFELRDYAHPLGVHFLTGRSLYHEGSDPYLPFIDALREYFKKEKSEEIKVDEKVSAPIGFIGHIGGLDKIESRSGEGAIPLGLLTTFGHESSSKREEIDIRKERDRMFETVLQLIISISKEKPLILFLDDLQWADSASLQLLYYISRNIRESRVLICCTYRPEDLLESEGKAHPLTDTIKRMSRERLFATINLKKLNY